jgi:hypothetical protein
MSEENIFEVDFHKYCMTCKYKDVAERCDPCNECLDTCGKWGTTKPEKYEKAK